MCIFSIVFFSTHYKVYSSKDVLKTCLKKLTSWRCLMDSGLQKLASGQACNILIPNPPPGATIFLHELATPLIRCRPESFPWSWQFFLPLAGARAAGESIGRSNQQQQQLCSISKLLVAATKAFTSPALSWATKNKQPQLARSLDVSQSSAASPAPASGRKITCRGQARLRRGDKLAFDSWRKLFERKCSRVRFENKQPEVS